MSWTKTEWEAFCALIEEGWPGEFDDRASASWRVLLDVVEPQEAIGALRRLLFEGGRFRPSVSELLAKVREDPGVPTWPEAYRLIFGPGGVLSARPYARRWASEAQRRQLFDEAGAERAGQLHPLVGGFIQAQGLDRLRGLPVDDPQWGDKTRRDLGREWDDYVHAHQGREVAALAAGSGREGLRKFDPLAALGIDRPKELTR